ncbi:hypothetical protein BDZ89DRAFT_50586 [Hymenopellis radicata]|nr:hypothetical protein BDZ89DRAFT_50586 [Hymenopellis radicata]
MCMPESTTMSSVCDESPSAEGYALAVSTPSTTPIHLSVNNAPALNASSPIQRLPRELFNQIFLYYNASNKCGALCLEHGCWPLLSVCRYWYEVTTTSPGLWCDIRVWVNCLAKWRDPVAGLSLVLSRAGKMDLHIDFDGSPVKDQEGNIVDNVSELALALLEVLMKHSAQWRTVHLFAIDTTCMRALDVVCTNLPRLLEVIIQQPEAGETLTLAYISAPLLKNLFVIFSVNSENVMPCTPLQSQLTEFKVRVPTTIPPWSTCCVIVSTSRSLNCNFPCPRLEWISASPHTSPPLSSPGSFVI